MPADNVSQEISHLVRDRGFPQKRAIAASLSMKRAGKFRAAPRASKRTAPRRG